jgi:hypothetical protein
LLNYLLCQSVRNLEWHKQDISKSAGRRAYEVVLEWHKQDISKSAGRRAYEVVLEWHKQDISKSAGRRAYEVVLEWHMQDISKSAGRRAYPHVTFSPQLSHEMTWLRTHSSAATACGCPPEPG